MGPASGSLVADGLRRACGPGHCHVPVPGQLHPACERGRATGAGALGQPTWVADTGGQIYANGVTYYPNGAIKQFTYGNGLVHTMAQNARQLPARSTDAGIIDYESSFDANGNVTALLDRVRGDHYSRWMTYDGLDRLTSAGSCSFGGDCWHRFSYDVLDNLKSWKLAGVKDYATYIYDGQNRLGNIRNSANATIVGLGYDAQGNLANKNGQLYNFDYGNRLRETAGKEWYRYDGHGRRVLNWRVTAPGAVSIYSQSGQMLYRENNPTATAEENIYLGGSLLAIRANTGTIKYQHTDALGSPVAVTNSAGAVIDRTDWEPYGAAIGKPAYDGVGYTGHVMDGATGLVYMQQRYFDKDIGRFDSVDPVTAYSNPVGAFNRYWYANNNPYKFTDPDGRCIWDACVVEAIAVGALIGMAFDVIAQKVVSPDKPIDGSSVVVSGLVGGLTGGSGAVLTQAVSRGSITVGQAVIRQAGASAAAGAAGSAAGDVADGKTPSGQRMTNAAGVGAAASLLGSGVTAATGGYSQAAKAGNLARLAAAKPNSPTGVVSNIASTTRSAGPERAAGATQAAMSQTTKLIDLSGAVTEKKLNQN